MSETASQLAACQDPSGCRVFTALTFVPGVNLTLCVYHKRQIQSNVRSQGKLICPNCNQEVEIRGARGQRGRNAARRIAQFAFDRHVQTCATRQAILKAQHTTNGE